METLAPFVLGGAIGVAITLAVFRRRLRRAELINRKSAALKRLAEAGSMTSGLAHEIKNPLSSVVLNAQLLREGILDSKLPEDELQGLVRRVDSLARETSRLKDILEDFLRFAGRVQLDKHDTDLREIVEELADFVHPQGERAGVLIRTDLPPTAAIALVDADVLKQAILNLLLNAIQVMEENPPNQRRELIVRVESVPATKQSEGEIRIHVIDTGGGIPEHLREEIFRPYVTTKRGGSGLGLAVAQRISQEHGGTIRVFSEVGKGSDFVIALPARGDTN